MMWRKVWTAAGILGAAVVAYCGLTANPAQAAVADGVISLEQPATLYQGFDATRQSTGRTLAAGTRWRVSATQEVDGVQWYEVATNAWVTENAQFNPVVYQPIKLAQPTTLYTGYGPDRQSTGRVLPIGSAWKVLNRVVVDDIAWYAIGANQWVTMDTSANPAVPANFTNAVLTVTVNNKNGAKIYSTYQPNRYQTGTLPFASRWRAGRQAVAEDGSLWYQLGTNQWISATSGITTGAVYPASAQINGVPLIAQRPELPNGCEITAVTMMLRYAGAKVDKMQLAREMPRSKDPNKGYIGNPWDRSGVTIFPPALMGLVQKYAGNAINMTGMSFDAIRYQVGLRQHPVVAWLTLHGFPFHAVVVIGYDASNVTYLDCWTNQRGTMSIAAFEKNWQTQKRRAISY